MIVADRFERDALGELTRLARGGQGIVYDGVSVTTRVAGETVYKEYTAQCLQMVDATALEAIPTFLDELPADARARLLSISAWPCATVYDSGSLTGFVMPKIPTDFFVDLTLANSTSRSLAEMQHLLNPPEFVAKLGIAITDEQRCELLRETASALVFLHANGVCVGDISPKNLLFRLSPPAVYFIDCDAMRVDGRSVLPQADTPNWWTPDGEEKATPQSDAYKLGLLALRMFAGEQHFTDPKSLPDSVPRLLRQLITDTLTRPAGKRPAPLAWTHILGRVIEDLQHQQASAPPAPTVALRPKPVAAARPAAPAQAPAGPAAPPVWTAPPRPTAAPPGTLDPFGLSGPPRSDSRTGRTLVLLAAIVGIAVFAVWGVHALNRQSDSSSSPIRTQTPSTVYVTPPTTSETTETSEPTTPWATPTSTTPPASTNRVPQPYWDGPWVRNYWEDPVDCDDGLNYWVVQPGSDAGMHALKLGCFPPDWKKKITHACQAYSLGGLCAVWDQNRIMSEFRKHGDLLVIALDLGCLRRAGLTDFHEGPLHADCVIVPPGAS